MQRRMRRICIKRTWGSPRNAKPGPAPGGKVVQSVRGPTANITHKVRHGDAKALVDQTAGDQGSGRHHRRSRPALRSPEARFTEGCPDEASTRELRAASTLPASAPSGRPTRARLLGGKHWYGRWGPVTYSFTCVES